MAVVYKARYGQPAAACTIGIASQPAAPSDVHHRAAAGYAGFAASAYWRPLQADSAQGDDAADELSVALPDPARAITPQQEFVMYDGEVRTLRLDPLWVLESMKRHCGIVNIGLLCVLVLAVS